jgi:hypothetical protein
MLAVLAQCCLVHAVLTVSADLCVYIPQYTQMYVSSDMFMRISTGVQESMCRNSEPHAHLRHLDTSTLKPACPPRGGSLDRHKHTRLETIGERADFDLQALLEQLHMLHVKAGTLHVLARQVAVTSEKRYQNVSDPRACAHLFVSHSNCIQHGR